MDNPQIITISETNLIRYLKNRWGIEEKDIPQTIQNLIDEGLIKRLADGKTLEIQTPMFIPKK